MKIIVGLGNPGEKYAQTRHNVGFMFIDFVNERLDGGKWKLEGKLKVQMVRIEENGEKMLLIKPQTFMNDSGIAVQKIVASSPRFAREAGSKELPVRDLIVVHDDLDIRLGEYKIQRGKGPKLHNGIESIEHRLGTTDFIRVRIGVDNRETDQRIPGEAYVLQNFTDEEQVILRSIFELLAQRLFE